MKEITFISSIFTFYLKGKIKIDRDFVWIKKPKSLIGFIPAGFEEWSVPIDQISSVGMYCMNFIDYLKRWVIIFLAVIAVLATLFTMPLVGLAILLVSGAVIANSFYTGLSVETIGKNDFSMFCPIIEKAKMKKVSSELHSMMRRRRTDTNVRVQNKTLIAAQNANTKSIIDAINSKNKK